MVRKRDRLIGTLVIWIAVFVAMSKIFDGLNYAPIWMQNYWYQSGGVVVGEDSATAMQIWEDFQSVSSGLFDQTRQIAQTDLFEYYLPYLLLLVLVLLVGAVLSTFFIWRSVIVPEAIASARRHEQSEPTPVASLLDDDGELMEPLADLQPVQNQRQESS